MWRNDPFAVVRCGVAVEPGDGAGDGEGVSPHVRLDRFRSAFTVAS